MPILSASREISTETFTPASAEDSEAVRAAVRAAAPSFAPNYPGAEWRSVTTRVTLTRSVEISFTRGIKFVPGRVSRVHSKTFTTTDTPQEVVWFYKSAAQGRRLHTTRDEFGADGKRTFEASRGRDHVTVHAAVEDGGSLVTVSYSVSS